MTALMKNNLASLIRARNCRRILRTSEKTVKKSD